MKVFLRPTVLSNCALTPKSTEFKLLYAFDIINKLFKRITALFKIVWASIKRSNIYH